MALAKAYPDTYMYEPHDESQVSLHVCFLYVHVWK